MKPRNSEPVKSSDWRGTEQSDRLFKGISAPINSMIEIVDAETFRALDEAMTSQRGPASDDAHDTWKQYHDSLCKVANQFGKIGSGPQDDIDFYYSGDWFHQTFDAFALQSAKVIRTDALLAFQRVVAKNGPGTTLNLVGDIGTPLHGLVILITPEKIAIAMEQETSEGCKKRLAALGIPDL